MILYLCKLGQLKLSFFRLQLFQDTNLCKVLNSINFSARDLSNYIFYIKNQQIGMIKSYYTRKKRVHKQQSQQTQKCDICFNIFQQSSFVKACHCCALKQCSRCFLKHVNQQINDFQYPSCLKKKLIQNQLFLGTLSTEAKIKYQQIQKESCLSGHKIREFSNSISQPNTKEEGASNAVNITESDLSDPVTNNDNSVKQSEQTNEQSRQWVFYKLFKNANSITNIKVCQRWPFINWTIKIICVVMYFTAFFLPILTLFLSLLAFFFTFYYFTLHIYIACCSLGLVFLYGKFGQNSICAFALWILGFLTLFFLLLYPFVLFRLLMRGIILRDIKRACRLEAPCYLLSDINKSRKKTYSKQ